MLPLFPPGNKHSCGTATAKVEEGAGNGRSVYISKKTNQQHSISSIWLRETKLMFSQLNIAMIYGFNSKDEIESYLAGVVIGDGHIEFSTNRIVISSNKKEFIEKISTLLDYLEIKYSEFLDKSAKVWKIATNSKKLGTLFKTKYNVPSGNKTHSEICPEIDNAHARYLISGLFDAEGWFEKDKGKYLRIRIKMKNRSIMNFVENLLQQWDFKPKKHIKADGSIVVEINRQSEVNSFLDFFILLHPRWLLINSSDG